jgi:hypothetical protein
VAEICPLCGFRYDAATQGCRPSCPVGGCGLVCCPNCGHGVPKEGPLASGLRRLLVSMSLAARAGERAPARRADLSGPGEEP